LSVVVSVRIPRWLKEKLERYGVNIAEVVRRSLAEEVERIEKREIMERLERLKRSLQGRIDPYELARLVEEERAER